MVVDLSPWAGEGNHCRSQASDRNNRQRFPDRHGPPLVSHVMQAAPRPPLIDRLIGHPAVRSAYTSLLAHVLFGILAALLAIRHSGHEGRPSLSLSFGDAAADAVDPLPPAVEIAAVNPLPAADPRAAEQPLHDVAAATVADAVPAEPADSIPQPPLVAIPAADAAKRSSVAAIPASAAAKPIAAAAAVVRPGPPQPEATGGDEAPFAARRGAARTATVKARGGSAASEEAVEKGLAWLASHQAIDGSWQFDLSGCQCHGACRNPGTLDSSTASTAIALLPFLGAGNTHADGPYQQVVSRAIYYLVSRMQPTPRGGDFCEGTMYGHGVTTLALAEAYGLSGDDMLVPYLRDAIRFIQTAQDQHGGGWRYLPGQAGDTTVTAWQVAALKSASLAGVETPSPTIDGVRRFLDRVQANNGAAYGYRSPQAKPCTSAIGLLCRMYTGWGPEHEALHRGAASLARSGPSADAVYQNFYLSQVLLQMNHPVWPRWNKKNRDQLVARQSRIGHETGSWFFADPDTAPGGRLAHTSLAILTLEVYYRLLPIYTEKAIEDRF
ncbi:MAG: prenyltransferase/squalene oxidase repeat-containing protein [Planctomycetia bacterium]